MVTLGHKLSEYHGSGPGFNFLRIALALAVLLAHCLQLFYGDARVFRDSSFWMLESSIVPMFFALSGFLVAGSAMRNSLGEFIFNRFIRIAPALIVEICLSALILGPLLTVFSLRDYFGDANLYRYFLNIIGWIHYELPGLFLDNPLPLIVNGSLWTIPHEIFCYVVMVILIASGALYKPRNLVMGFCAILLLVAALQLMFGRSQIIDLLGPEGFKSLKIPMRLLPYFILGCSAYQLRNVIPYSRVAFVLSIAVAVSISLLISWENGQSLALQLILCPFLVYIVVFVGLTPIKEIPLYSKGDYSYGIYLYGFPLQQGILYLLRDRINLAAFVLLSVLTASLFAAFSWHVIEKPILKLRKKIVFARPSEQPA